MTHNPIEFATALSAKLATRSRHVCILLGAGASCACGLPDVAALTEKVLSALEPGEKELFSRQLEGRNLEAALSRLRSMAALLNGDQEVDGLTSKTSLNLDNLICQEIVKALKIEGADIKPACHLAAWTARGNYHQPIEIFTLNYDLLIETALENLRVPYFDGFIGTLRAKFYTELVENNPGAEGESIPEFFVRLWKLHGSVNWVWQDDRQIVRLGQPVLEGRPAAIYPTDTKYVESRRVPFIVLQDRLRRALHQPETILIVSGYSFGDADINELIFDAVTRRQRSEFMVFCYSNIPDELSEKATTIPNLQAISGKEAVIGGIKGEWSTPKDPPPNLWIDEQFALTNFSHLAAYLARSTIREFELDAVLMNLVRESVAKAEIVNKENGDA